MAKGFDGGKLVDELLKGFSKLNNESKKAEKNIDDFTESVVKKTKVTKKSADTDKKLAHQIQKQQVVILT